MPQQKKCLISLVVSDEEVDYIVDHGKALFEQESSLPLFQNTDFEYVREFFKKVISGKLASPYFLCVFKDIDTEEIVGAVMFSIGSPWYNKGITVISEELTMSFKKGYGIARQVASYMSYWVNHGRADVATGASAQASVSNQVANSYKKIGYKEYPTFYLIDKNIEQYNSNKK